MTPLRDFSGSQRQERPLKSGFTSSGSCSSRNSEPDLIHLFGQFYAPTGEGGEFVAGAEPILTHHHPDRCMFVNPGNRDRTDPQRKPESGGGEVTHAQ